MKITFIFIYLLFNHSYIQHDVEKTCDRELLNIFNLDGRKNPRLNTYVDICGVTMDTCCTLLDQAKILKFWNQYSNVHISHQTFKIISAYKAILQIHELVLKQNPEKIPMHIRTTQQIIYSDMKCVKEQKGGDRKLHHNKNINNNSPERNLELLQKNIQIPLQDREMKAIKNVNFLRDRFGNVLNNAIFRVKKYFENDSQKIDDIKSKITKLFTQENDIKLKSERDEKYFDKIANDMNKQRVSQNSKDIFAGTIYDDQFYTANDLKQQHENKFKKYRQLLDNIQSFNDNKGKIFMNFLEQNQKISLEKITPKKTSSNYISQLLQDINTKIIPQMRTLNHGHHHHEEENEEDEEEEEHKYPREFPTLTRISNQKITCYQDDQHAIRNFYVINTAKYKFCKGVHDELHEFDIEGFIHYLGSVETAILSIQDTKKSLYCVLCNVDKQKNINITDKTIFLNQNFCRDFLSGYKAYLLWKNYYFANYIFKVLQYVQCHNTKGDNYDFPYNTLANKIFKESFYVKRCLDNIYDENYLRYCHFLCEQYRFEKFTEMIDGNIKLLKSFYFRIISFLRKFNIQVPPLLQMDKMQNLVDDYESKPHMDELIQRDIQSMIDESLLPINQKKARILEEDDEEDSKDKDNNDNEDSEEDQFAKLIREPIWLNKSIPELNFDELKFYFLKYTGINPIIENDAANFDYSIEQYVKMRSEKSQATVLQQDTLQVVLYRKDVVDKFNDDIFNWKKEPNEENEEESVDESLLTEKQLNIFNIMNPKKEEIEEIQQEETIGQKEGIPELDYLFRRA